MWRSVLLAVLSGAAAASARQPAEERSPRPFTTEMSVQLPRVLPLEVPGARRRRQDVALFSPERTQFVVQVRRGDLKRDVNIDSLLVWQVAEINAALTGAMSHPPNPRLLTERSFAEDGHGISDLTWLSETEIGFIAQSDSGPSQVFICNTTDGQITQVTHSATDVVSYAIRGDRGLYFARANHGRPTVVDATDMSIHEIVSEDNPALAPIELFRFSRSGGRAVRIEGPAVRLITDEIWLSPSGNQAITLTPATVRPQHWGRYAVYFKDRTYTSVSSSDPTSTELLLRARYQLVDLRSGRTRPLLDAPAGFLSYTQTPPVVFWPEDGNSVVVSHTYLPLADAEAERNARGPAIAEVDLNRGTARVIEWEPTVTYEELKAHPRPLERILSIEWDDEHQTLVVDKVNSAGARWRTGYQRRGKEWVRFESGGNVADPPITVELRQGLNERPRLYASGSVPGAAVELLDPLSELENVTPGRVSKVTWLDHEKREWRAGLVYPVGFEPGKRYPLVVQTHGFDENEFLIDGPRRTGTAFAAQALANAGMFVMQVAEGRSGAVTGDTREAFEVASGLKAGIDRLVSEGWVDPSRVGLIGWSRTGFHVVGFLAHFPDAVAAVSISDAVQYGYAQLLMLSNRDDIREFESVTGGLPGTIGFGKWFDSNPLYRIARSKAAIRVEAIGEPYSMWETVSILRRAGKSVDLLYFPRGSHVLSKPSERLASQSRTVDWFRFWLQGYEDSDPRKKALYERWKRF